MRIFAYGCSFTYGEGLKDCWVPEGEKIGKITGPSKGPYPSAFAWPQLLSNRMELDVVNKSIPGCSNKYIWHEIMNANLNSNDIVVILWTHFNRNCVFENKIKNKRALVSDINNKHQPRDNQRFSAYYYKIMHEDYDAAIENYLKINFTKHHLDSLGIKNYHFCLSRNLSYEIPSWNTVDIKFVELNYELPLAVDNLHPGELAQVELANEMYDFIHK